MSDKRSTAGLLQTAIAAIAMVPGMHMVAATHAYAQAAIFEVVHPDVEQGETEIEVLNGVGLGSVEDGDERSVHEFAIGYGLTDIWKFTAAVEVANPESGNAEVEAFEFENLILLPFIGGGHHHGGKTTDDNHTEFALGFYTALEVPREGGIDAGGIAFGPVFETEVGSLKWVGNLLIEVPFEEGDPGLSYASQIVFPLNESVGIGVENFGEFEGAFGDAGEQEHYAGPALYFETELPNGHVIEPRAAVLFGLNDNSSDAIFSLNLEYKIGKN